MRKGRNGCLKKREVLYQKLGIWKLKLNTGAAVTAMSKSPQCNSRGDLLSRPATVPAHRRRCGTCAQRFLQSQERSEVGSVQVKARKTCGRVELYYRVAALSQGIGGVNCGTAVLPGLRLPPGTGTSFYLICPSIVWVNPPPVLLFFAVLVFGLKEFFFGAF